MERASNSHVNPKLSDPKRFQAIHPVIHQHHYMKELHHNGKKLYKNKTPNQISEYNKCCYLTSVSSYLDTDVPLPLPPPALFPNLLVMRSYLNMISALNSPGMKTGHCLGAAGTHSLYNMHDLPLLLQKALLLVTPLDLIVRKTVTS